MKNKYELRILHTSDTHGYIYPQSYSTQKAMNIGIAKLNTLIKSLRTTNTLLIDSGDTIQGSPLMYHHSKDNVEAVNPMAKVMNFMKYDYITIGNHEFNYGLQYLNGFLKNVKSKILNCNILDTNSHKPFIGITHDIINITDGPKIGIIGVTTHYIPNWEQPSHLENLIIKDAFTSLNDLVSIVKPQVDFLIVNYHGGFERDFKTFSLNVEDTGENQGSKMLKEIDGIDLLLTGHQHRMLSGKLYDTYYSQPGFNAQHLAKIDITFTFNSSWNAEISGELIGTNDVIADSDILELVEESEQATQLYLDTPVGILDKDFLITDQLHARLHKHELISLINQIQLDYTNADIALCGLGNDVSGFRKEITIRDIIGTYIYPNTLVVKEMSGKDIIRAIEKTAEFFTLKDGEIAISDQYSTPKLQLYAYDMYDGIEYTLKIGNKVGERVIDITKDGKPFDLDKKYSVCMNNYRSSGGGDYLFIKDCKIINDTQTEIMELLINYIVKTKEIKINHKDNIKIIK